MSAVLWFACGAAGASLAHWLVGRVAKSSFGKRTGFGRDVRKKLLTSMDHDALKRLHTDVDTELVRRRT